MKRLMFALPLLALLATQAHADPKTITVEQCAKVSTEVVKSERTTMTVTCTGEANDPKVKAERTTTGFISLSPAQPLTGSCVNSRGESVPC